GPAFLKLEFVDESFSGLDVGLGQAADAIHAARHQHAVPVDCRVIGQLAGHEQAYLVALHCLDGGPWRLAVVAPQMRMDSAVNRRLKPSCAAFPGPRVDALFPTRLVPLAHLVHPAWLRITRREPIRGSSLRLRS